MMKNEDVNLISASITGACVAPSACKAVRDSPSCSLCSQRASHGTHKPHRGPRFQAWVNAFIIRVTCVCFSPTGLPVGIYLYILYHNSLDKLSVSSNLMGVDFPYKLDSLFPLEIVEKLCKGTSQARMNYLWIDFKTRDDGKLSFV